MLKPILSCDKTLQRQTNVFCVVLVAAGIKRSAGNRTAQPNITCAKLRCRKISGLRAADGEDSKQSLQAEFRRLEHWLEGYLLGCGGRCGCCGNRRGRHCKRALNTIWIGGGKVVGHAARACACFGRCIIWKSIVPLVGEHCRSRL